MPEIFNIDHFCPDAIILGDGDFPTHNIPARVLHNAKYVCCCDGAAARLIEKGIVPDAIVGDGDSLADSFKQKYRGILHIVKEQEDNDLTKATRFCTSLGFKNIAYLGATGKREDHTISNISLLARYKSDFGISPVMFTNFGFFVPIHGRQEFASFPHQQVSIFNLTCSRLESEGLKWRSYAYSQLWQGSLNEPETCGFTLDADGDYLIYMTYEPKKPQ